MPDILQDFPIAVPAGRVYEAVSSPAGLNQWWTMSASGTPQLGNHCDLGFGPGFDWRAVVTKAEPARAFELLLRRYPEAGEFVPDERRLEV